MNGTAQFAPLAISWGKDRLDYFHIGQDDAAYHKYWDGSQWSPPGHWSERLEGKFTSGLAANSWSANRIDIVGRGPYNRYWHKYWDGSSWKPSQKQWEDFGGGNFTSKPAVISWGPNRFDVFGIDEEGCVLHKYWKGDAWVPSVTEWENMGCHNFVGTPVATSWKKNTFDVWAIDEGGEFYYKYWNEWYYSDWTPLGGKGIFDTIPQSVHLSDSRHDIVGLSNKGEYMYKYYDNDRWFPSQWGWYTKGESYEWATNPSMVITGEDQFDIVGVDTQGNLGWQRYTRSGWYPSWGQYENLGPINAIGSKTSSKFVVQEL